MALALTYIGSATSTATAASVDFGNFNAATAGLMVVVFGSGAGVGSASVSSISIGGTNGALVDNGNVSITHSSIAYREVSSGNNDVTVVLSATLSSSPGRSVDVYLLTGYENIVPYDTSTANDTASATSKSVSLAIPDGGVGIAGIGHTNTNASTWTGLTADRDATVGGSRLTAASLSGKTNYDKLFTASASWTGAVRCSGVSASWAPAVSFLQPVPIGSVGATTTGTKTVTAPWNVPSGALVFEGIGESAAVLGTVTPGDSNSDTFTSYSDTLISTIDAVGAWAVAGAALTSINVAFGAATTVNGLGFGGLYFTGQAASSPEDTAVRASASGLAGTPTVTSGSPAVPGEMMLALIVWIGTDALTDDSGHGWATAVSGSGGSGATKVNWSVAYQNNAGTGTKIYAPTGPTGNWEALTMGFKPVVGDDLLPQSVM
jgi:hypothetical protein